MPSTLHRTDTGVPHSLWLTLIAIAFVTSSQLHANPSTAFCSFPEERGAIDHGDVDVRGTPTDLGRPKAGVAAPSHDVTNNGTGAGPATRGAAPDTVGSSFALARTYKAEKPDTTCASATDSGVTLLRIPAGALACRLPDVSASSVSQMAAGKVDEICLDISEPRAGVWALMSSSTSEDAFLELLDAAAAPKLLIAPAAASPCSPGAEAQALDIYECSPVIAQTADGSIPSASLSQKGALAEFRLANTHPALANRVQGVSFAGARADEAFSVEALNDGALLRVKAVTAAPRQGLLDVLLSNRFGERSRFRIELPPPPEGALPGITDLDIEIALAHKLIADEDFLRLGTAVRDDPAAVAGIRARYDQALAELPKCSAVSPCKGLRNDVLATIALINADIAYRKHLLDHSIPFSGGVRSLRPTTPHQELVKINDALKGLADLTDSIERWQARQADLSLVAAKEEANSAYASGQELSERRRADIEEIQAFGANSSIERDRQLTQRLQSYVQQAAAEQASIAAQQERLGQAATKLVQAGLAAASGIPVEQIDRLSHGDLRGVAETYVREQLSAEASAFAQDFIATNDAARELSDQVAQFKEEAAEIRRTINSAEEAKRSLEAAALVLRGNLDGTNELLAVGQRKLGNAMLAHISANNAPMIARLDSIMEETRPIGSFLRSAEADADRLFRERGGRAAYSAYQSLLANATARFVPDDEVLDGLRGELTEEVLGRIPAATVEKAQAQILALIARSDRPARLHDVVSEFYPAFPTSNLIEEALRGVPEARAAQIRHELSQLSTGRLPGKTRAVRFSLVSLDETSGELSIRVREGNGGRITLSYVRLLQQLAAMEPMINLPVLREVVTREDLLGSRAAQFIALQTLKSPSGVGTAIDAELRGQNSDSQVRRVWADVRSDQVLAAQTDNVRADLLSYIAFRPGVGATTAAAPETEAGARRPSRSSPSDLAPESDPVLSAALNYAFPGAGVALQLGQTWAAMDANTSRINQLNAEILGAITELEVLRRSIDAAQLDAVTASKEAERRRALANAFNAQLEHNRVVIDGATSEIEQYDQRLRMYRPLFFYRAELLRERFDAFDQSLAMWSHGTPESGFFASQIVSDPRQTRLALDSEIHLFGWLNRDREASRTDPFQLTAHWQHLHELVENYCTETTCIPGAGNGAMGRIGVTGETMVLGDLLSASEVDKFRTWQRSAGEPRSHTVRLTLTPAMNLISSNLENVRMIDLTLVARDSSGRSLSGSAANVAHTGFALIPVRARDGTLRWHAERLLGSRSMASFSGTALNLEELSRRFQGQDSITALRGLRPFEGYGFYGILELEFTRTHQTRDISDVALQIAYSYQDSSSIRTEADFVSRFAHESGQSCSESGRTGAANEEARAPETVCSAKLEMTFAAPMPNGKCSDGPVHIALQDDASLATWTQIYPLLDPRAAPAQLVGEARNEDTQHPLRCMTAHPRLLTRSVPDWMRNEP